MGETFQLIEQQQEQEFLKFEKQSVLFGHGDKSIFASHHEYLQGNESGSNR